MPMKIVAEITSIQRNFLWDGSRDKRKIPWVKWSDVCKPKAEGGLGLKCISNFNIALLSKWKWRIINENNLIWSSLIHFRYCESINKLLHLGSIMHQSKDSIWWRDILALKINNSFASNIACRLGNDAKIHFWKHKWLGHISFERMFPSMFETTINKNAIVVELFLPSDGVMRWSVLDDFGGARSAATDAEFATLCTILAEVRIEESVTDSFKWALDSVAGFSVKSFYNARNATTRWETCLSDILIACTLAKRGVVHESHNSICVLCSQRLETVDHFFFSCIFAKPVWNSMFAWLQISWNEGASSESHLSTFCAKLKGRRLKKLKGMFWAAIVWSIWLMRNDVIFNNVVGDASLVVDSIKTLS